jgi:hypothetical protein
MRVSRTRISRPPASQGAVAVETGDQHRGVVRSRYGGGRYRLPSTAVRFEAAVRASPHRVHPVHFGTTALAQGLLDRALHDQFERRDRPRRGFVLTEV